MFFVKLSNEMMHQFRYNGTLRSSSWMERGSKLVIHLRGKTVCGPFEIYEINDARRIAFLRATSEYGLYKTMATCEGVCTISDSDIKPVQTVSESVTGSHMIDGVLSNAYEDRGTIKVLIPIEYKQLLEFIVSELNRLEIGHSVGIKNNDVFITIQDREIVERIFMREPQGEYPIEYLLGYLSLQIAVYKRYHNSGSKYNEYHLRVFVDPEQETDIFSGTSLLIGKKYEGVYILCPCFGHMLPISKIIDDAIDGEDEYSDEEPDVQISEGEDIDEIRRILAPLIIRKMFEYMKYKPGPLENNDGSMATLRIMQPDDGTPLEIAIAPGKMPETEWFATISLSIPREV